MISKCAKKIYTLLDLALHLIKLFNISKGTHDLMCFFDLVCTAKPSRKLGFIYLANDVVQNSKKKGPEFNKEFAGVMPTAFGHVYE